MRTYEQSHLANSRQSAKLLSIMVYLPGAVIGNATRSGLVFAAIQGSPLPVN